MLLDSGAVYNVYIYIYIYINFKVYNCVVTENIHTHHVEGF